MQNQRLRSEARALLDAGLRDVLERHGELHVMGSYALGLMTWRDLDLHLVRSPNDIATCFALGGEVAALLAPHRMHFRNELLIKSEDMPLGLYWGIYLGDERAGAWKIDLWQTDRNAFETVRAFTERLDAQLTKKRRATILAIKSECWQHPGYRREFSAADIYRAVIDRGVRNIDEFWIDLRHSRSGRQ